MDSFPIFKLNETIPETASSSPRFSEIVKEKKWRYETLYKNSTTGALMEWWVGFDTSTNEMLMSHGHVGGIININKTDVVVNQSGRSIHQQAVLEARNRYNLQYRNKGYRPKGSEPPKLKEPMKANKLEDKTRLKFPMGIQSKLDGFRCMVREQDEEIHYRSKGTREWNHLRSQFDEELKNFFSYLPQNIELDGELYIHGKKLNEIMSIVRNERILHSDIGYLNYYIFDYNTTEETGYRDRYKILERALEKYNEDGHSNTRFFLIETLIVNSREDIQYVFREYRDLGYEGCMLRKLDAPYKNGRSSNILKVKERSDEEGVIIEVESAEGTEKGLALFVVRDPRGNEFRLRPAATFEERREWMLNPSEVIGRQYTYMYADLSVYGIPQQATGKGFRDEDE